MVKRKIILLLMLSLFLSACKKTGSSPESQSSPTTGSTPTNPYFEDHDNPPTPTPAPTPIPTPIPTPTPPEDEDPPVIPPDNEVKKADLGRYLFHDKVLSGNKNISCSTCHPVWRGTADGLSLPIGEGGVGVSLARTAGYAFERVPRNTQALFNLGLLNVQNLFHDGRVSTVDGVNFDTPAGDQLPAGLESVLAAQALFPLINPVEMSGNDGGNLIAQAVAANDLPAAWELIAWRIRRNPEYVALFKEAFGDVTEPIDIKIQHIANAIAAYETTAFRADNSPYDKYLAGDQNALSPAALRGMDYFYGEAACFRCHSGDFQTDFEFHSIGMPQIGPGKGVGQFGLEDFGREAVTGQPEDRYKFRTPSLRNVAVTGPWGHSGAYTSLRSMVEHYRTPEFAMADYNELVERPILPFIGQNGGLDFAALFQPSIVRAVGESHQVQGRTIPLTDDVVDDLLAFLRSLTDSDSLRMNPPDYVPSGFSVD